MMGSIYNPYHTQENIIELVQRQIIIFGGLRAFCRHYDVPPCEISRLLAGKCTPSHRLIEALGFERVVYYFRKGSL